MAALVVVSGLPCTGKSTVSQGIARALGFPVFSVDPIEAAILRSGIPRSFETGLAAYIVAGALAEEHLKLGHPAIIDAVSPVIESREWWEEIAARRSAQLIVIECVCSDATLHRQRLESRTRDIEGFPEPTWADIEERKREYLEWTRPRLVLDALEHAGENIKNAIAHVQAGARDSETGKRK
jgi:predicted kinase